MYIFMLTFLPLMFFLLLSISSGKFSFFSDRVVKTYLLSLLFAFLYSFLEILFSTALTYRQIQKSVFLNWSLLYLYDFLIPFLVLSFLIFISSRKPLLNKINSLLPVLFGFYSVYFVYSSILRNEKVSNFLLFCKPVLICCQIILVSILLIMFYESLIQKKKVYWPICLGFAFFLSSILPSFIQTLYTLDYVKIVRILLTFFYEISTILLVVFFVLLKSDSSKLKFLSKNKKLIENS